MEEIGLPCSVITSHGAPQNASANIVHQQQSFTMPSLNDMNQHNERVWKLDSLANDSLSQINEFIANSTFCSSVADDFTTSSLEAQRHQSLIGTASGQKLNSSESSSSLERRLRKEKRPFSPELPGTIKKPLDKRKGTRVLKKTVKSKASDWHPKDSSTPDTLPNGDTFCCDRCKSPYIINPSKIRKSNKKWKKPVARKKVDPLTNKLLILCNACGIAMDKPQKQKPAKVIPSEEDKTKYMSEACSFAASLAKVLHDADAERLYCPSFKKKPCKCLQKYIVGNGETEGRLERGYKLLQFLKDAKKLSQPNVLPERKEVEKRAFDKENTSKDCTTKSQGSQSFTRKRSKIFEDFVLTNRKYLKEEIRLCERACQRILMYSNNFLHKKLKASPTRERRLEKKNSNVAKGLLKPICDLPHEHCCGDKCVNLALTHPMLLETWRKQAGISQRSARCVLSEMLTPSGGSKANCYKFIQMVTGCCFTTICSVNEYMKKTRGVREPPEHGLKKWWRDHPRKQKTDNNKRKESTDESEGSSEKDSASENMDSVINIPTQEELQNLSPEEATIQLQVQRRQLIQMQKLLNKQQMQITQQQQIIEQHILQQPSNNAANNTHLQQTIQHLLQAAELAELNMSEPKSAPQMASAKVDHQMRGPTVVTASPAVQASTSVIHVKDDGRVTVLAPVSAAGTATSIGTQQLLHILEIPTPESSASSVITSVADASQSQTISVMASGDFEPITNISMGLPASQASFSKFTILPETAIEAATSQPVSVGQGAAINYGQSIINANTDEMNITVCTPGTTGYSTVPVTFTHHPGAEVQVSSRNIVTHKESMATTYQLYGVGDVIDQSTGSLITMKVNRK